MDTPIEHSNEKNDCCENENNLLDLKDKYLFFKKKYDLPEFDKLNEDFYIEKICENETDFILREIRKFIADRTSNYLRFIENLLNPSSASIFIFSFCKTLSMDDKKEIEEIYKKFIKLELDLMETDIVYSEQKEADFIKKSFNEWSDFKIKWKKILEKVKSNWDNKSEIRNNKGYFG
jgi:hypothetical protein